LSAAFFSFLLFGFFTTDSGLSFLSFFSFFSFFGLAGSPSSMLLSKNFFWLLGFWQTALDMVQFSMDTGEGKVWTS
jgi:hypothetical protein